MVENPITVLRSLVAPKENQDEFVLRRNLTRESLEQALADGDLLWIDITNPEDDEIRWLEHTFDLHPTVVSDLRRLDRRPSLMIYPEYVFISVFQAKLGSNQVESEEIHCIAGDTWFVTVRNGESSAIDAAYDRAAHNQDYWRRGIMYMMYLAIQMVIDSYYPLLDRISNQLNRLEETVMFKRDRKVQQSVYRIKQHLIYLRQMIAPQREVLANIIGEERIVKSGGENRDLFRHLYERLLRIYDVIDSQRDLSSNVLELIESQENSRLANAVSRLTVLSMVFLPLTFLIGLFGLNFITTDPELVISLPGGIVFLLLIVITAITALMMGWYFRRQGWL